MNVPFEPFLSYNVIIVFLIVLQLLHIMWFYYIFNIAKTALTGGQVRDERSDDEEFDEKVK